MVPPLFVAVGPENSPAAIAVGDEPAQIVPGADLAATLQSARGHVLVVHSLRPLAETVDAEVLIQADGLFETAGYLRHRGFDDSEEAGAALFSIDLKGGCIEAQLEVTRRIYWMAVADDTFPDHEFEVAHRTARINLRGVHIDGPTAIEFQRALVARRDHEMHLFVRAHRDFDCRRLEHDDEVRAYAGRRWGTEAHAVLPDEAVNFISARERLRNLKRALRRAERYVELSKGGSARHVLRYYGAHTGRFAARSSDAGINLHQLWKEKPDLPELRLERRVVIPPSGSLFRAGDLAAIEARIVAWLAREDALLERFASGEDVYSWFAAQIVPGVEISKKGPNGHLRALGKTCILGLGFGMGLAAFIQRAEAEAPGCSQAQIELAYDTYCTTFSRTQTLRKSLWPSCIRAFVDGDDISAAPETWIRRGGDLGGVPSLVIDLPTGRSLHFAGVVHEDSPIAPAGTRGLWYAPECSVASKHRLARRHERARRFTDGRWRVPLSPHVVLENIAQAIARDIMAHQSLALEELGLRTAFHAHDEIVLECLDCGCHVHSSACAWSSAGNDLIAVMSRVPATLPRLHGLPLACELNDQVEKSYA